ncbi:MAG: hypothetical protein BGO90_07720 [Legionella sp. 40-6]|nr:MAG: hypothetical protein BGO90_07720 [Legionella sp. 40-6]
MEFTNDSSAWFDIVNKIYNCPDMQNITFFYRIFPLQDTSKKIIEYNSEESSYILSPDKEYNFKVLNFHPQKRGEGKIIIDKTFMSNVSSSDIEIDSRYDLSLLSIRTAKSYYTDKFGFYRISCILNEDFIVTNTFKIKIKNNLFIKIITILLFTVLATFINSLFDNKQGMFDFSKLPEYGMISALIVFSDKAINFIEDITNRIKDFIKKIRRKS